MKKEISLLEKIKMIDDTKKIFEKELEKRLSLTKVGSPLFVSNNFGMNGEHVDKRYRDDDRSVVQNRGEAQEKDSESQNNDKYSE